MTLAPPDAPLPAWAALPPPRRGVEVIVVVPVRDEASNIVDALFALAAQRDGATPESADFDVARFEVLVLCNNCSDDSAALARAFAQRRADMAIHVVDVSLPPEDAHIGYVRRQLMDEACRRLARARGETSGHASGLVASTDADTRVAPDWLASTLAEARRGAAAIGGRILTDDTVVPPAAALRQRRLDLEHALLRSRLESLLDPDPYDPWPRHHQHFGASLAVTAEGYLRVGGVPRVRFLEDDALVRAFVRADLPVRHSPHVRVTTSSRLDGRAEVGLAWQLRQFADAESAWRDPPVEPPHRFLAMLEARAGLRRQCAHAGRRFGAEGAALEQSMRDALASRNELVPMSAAVAGLRAALRDRLAAPRRPATPAQLAPARARVAATAAPGARQASSR